MGQKISYFKNNNGKGLKDLLIENYTNFRDWYLDFEKSSLEGYNQPFGHEKLKTYLRKGTNLASEFDKLDKQLIDELTSDFIGYYCDLTDRKGEILQFYGPTMSKGKYEESTKMIAGTKDEDFLRLWKFIIYGRSLADNLEFNSYSSELNIGFLSRQEAEQLKSKIEYYFGNTSPGFEFVLTAINELTNNNKEIITAIDM